MSDITKIKVNGDPESSYQLYPRNEEFAKRAGGNTGSQSGGGSIPKPLTYDYMPEGYPSKSVLFDIEWDGDTSGLVSFANSYYKVANYTAVTKADLVGCVVSLQNDDSHPTPFSIKESSIYDTKIPHAILVSDYAIFVSEPTSYGPYNFTESGIYLAKMGELYTARLSKQTITPIEEEFLPAIVATTVFYVTNGATFVHADGTDVEAQEAYDAFMNTRVFIVNGRATYEAISMEWYDKNSAQVDPTNVGYVRLSYVSDSSGTASLVTQAIGDSSLIPA